MNFLDLVIIGGILLGGLAGYHKGLINSVIGTIATFISLVVAFATYKIFTPILNTQLGVGILIQRILKDTITLPAAKTQPIGNGDPLNKLSLVTNALPVGLQKEFNQMFTNLLHTAVGTTIKTIGDAITQYFTLLIVSMLAFFIIFIITNLVIRLFGNALTSGFDKNIAGTLNNSGGFVAGSMAAFLFIAILTGFIVPLFALYSPTLTRLVNESLLTSYFLNVFMAINNFVGL
ncbi:MAG TPA: CvpA family protein [Candidatus Deferrimicrobium sp.]|nr:CvpA family protein [Candidatus Deferrimicrobium sp.]